MAKRGRPPHPDILTPREWEVHALLREGLSNEEIAERLGISLAGAKYHVSEILGKLGVESRAEAAAWTRTQRPWWQMSVAPIAGLWQKASVSWLSIGATAVVAIAVAGGIGLLVWGLARTDGGGPAPPEPYVASPIDCANTYATPEEALAGCVFAYFSFNGDCDTREPPATPADSLFENQCSRWVDGPSALRWYRIDFSGIDSHRGYVVEQRGEGWTVVGRGGCTFVHQRDRERKAEEAGLDPSIVQPDNCTFGPLPMPRPSMSLGKRYDGYEVENGQTRMLVLNAALFPGRGVKFDVYLSNTTDETQAWASDTRAGFQLVAEDGTAYDPSGVGGTLARDVADGIPARRTWQGWLVFPVEEQGAYTLRYPNQADLVLDLTQEFYRQDTFPDFRD